MHACKPAARKGIREGLEVRYCACLGNRNLAVFGRHARFLLTAASTSHWVQAYLETHGHHADQEKVADLLAKVCAATA